MKLGLVTYNMGKDMDCPTLIEFCKKTGLAGVELRTTHAHGVELTLNRDQRAEVKKLFEDSPIKLVGLGTACEYHSKDPAEVKKNVEESIEFAKLCADVGGSGIKVRPNRLHDDVPPEQTCEQIGHAIREVAVFAEGIGIEVRVECHGNGTKHPKMMRLIMDYADHANAKVCWNSDPKVDLDANGSMRWSFDLLKDKWGGTVHIRDLGVYDYPWQELFDLLKGINYAGYCLAEIDYNPEPERFMQYYRTLYDLYTGNYRFPNPDFPIS